MTISRYETYSSCFEIKFRARDNIILQKENEKPLFRAECSNISSFWKKIPIGTLNVNIILHTNEVYNVKQFLNPDQSL